MQCSIKRPSGAHDWSSGRQYVPASAARDILGELEMGMRVGDGGGVGGTGGSVGRRGGGMAKARRGSKRVMKMEENGVGNNMPVVGAVGKQEPL